jgi:hypothetical protein
MRQISIVLIALAFTTFFSSCTKDDNDTTPPVIVLIEPADDDTLFIGHEVHLDMELSDDVKLKSYKIDIHSNLDGHDHTKSATANATWSFTKSWDLSGLRNTDIHHHEIIVPTEINGVPIAAGDYHFAVYCTDEAGNESKVIIDVVVGVGVPDEDE